MEQDYDHLLLIAGSTSTLNDLDELRVDGM